MTKLSRTKGVTAEHTCTTCGSVLEWAYCPECEDGYSDHDCGEDTCCCLDPYPNVRCNTCGGNNGWTYCPSCNPGAGDD